MSARPSIGQCWNSKNLCFPAFGGWVNTYSGLFVIQGPPYLFATFIGLEKVTKRYVCTGKVHFVLVHCNSNKSHVLLQCMKNLSGKKLGTADSIYSKIFWSKINLFSHILCYGIKCFKYKLCCCKWVKITSSFCLTLMKLPSQMGCFALKRHLLATKKQGICSL